jgi:fructuronate reductase
VSGPTRLSRRPGEPIPPIRIVHLGLGAFGRAHQAWYTDLVDTRREWGIAAFTGRDPAGAVPLAEQDGLFTLLERSADGDVARVVASVVEADDGASPRLRSLLAAPDVAVVTITVTEAGYRLRADSTLDLDDRAIAADLEALASGRPVGTVLGRLVDGLRARCAAGSGALAIVPCDNLPSNGPVVRAALLQLARRFDEDLTAWIGANVSVVSTSVDRITPRTTPDDAAVAARLTGFRDESPVVTEPFSDWVLCGDFPAGRPAWERAGARFVDDVEPFERRKLLLLNGAHSLLAYEGLLAWRGTVAEAIADPVLLAAVEAFWDAAVRHLPGGLGLDDYRSRLLDRFKNPRIEHRLVQIAADGVAKLRLRVAPVVLAEAASGRSSSAAVGAISAWMALRIRGEALPDAAAASVDAALADVDPVRVLANLVDPRIAADPAVLADVRSAVERRRAPRSTNPASSR